MSKELENVGTCRFCRQLVQIPYEDAEFLTEVDGDITEAATRRCTCRRALEYQARIEKVKDAKEIIKKKFESFPEIGEILAASVEAVHDGRVKKVDASNDYGIKGSLTLNSKGNLKVSKNSSKNESTEI